MGKPSDESEAQELELIDEWPVDLEGYDVQPEAQSEDDTSEDGSEYEE